MANDKLDKAKREAAIEVGAQKFFSKYPQLWASDANTAVLSGIILQKDLGPLDDVNSWEKACEIGKNFMCGRPEPKLEPPVAPPEWPHKFMRPVRTIDDVNAYPPQEYRALWFDKAKGGVPSEKANTFRSIVQSIIDQENAKRGR